MLNKMIQSVKDRIEVYKRDHSLPGSWKLVEYYTEPGDELLNFKEEQIVSDNLHWEITFSEEGEFTLKSNLNISVLEGLESGNWSKSRNFVTLLHPDDFRKNTEFQFAFDKGNLKLLKKDGFGKIIVFAFFKRLS